MSIIGERMSSLILGNLFLKSEIDSKLFFVPRNKTNSPFGDKEGITVLWKPAIEVLEDLGLWEDLEKENSVSYSTSPPLIHWMNQKRTEKEEIKDGQPFDFGKLKAKKLVSDSFWDEMKGRKKHLPNVCAIPSQSLYKYLKVRLEEENSFIQVRKIRSVENDSSKARIVFTPHKSKGGGGKELGKEEEENVGEENVKVESDILVDCEGLGSVKRLNIDFNPPLATCPSLLIQGECHFSKLRGLVCVEKNPIEIGELIIGRSKNCPSTLLSFFFHNNNQKLYWRLTTNTQAATENTEGTAKNRDANGDGTIQENGKREEKEIENWNLDKLGREVEEKCLEFPFPLNQIIQNSENVVQSRVHFFPQKLSKWHNMRSILFPNSTIYTQLLTSPLFGLNDTLTFCCALDLFNCVMEGSREKNFITQSFEKFDRNQKLRHEVVHAYSELYSWTSSIPPPFSRYFTPIVTDSLFKKAFNLPK